MSQAVQLNELKGGVTPAKEKPNLLSLLANPKVKEGFSRVIGSAMSPDRMVQLCITAAKGNEKLMACEPMSVLGSMMAAASLGLEPNTPQGQAYLIPYAKREKVNGQWQVVGYECQFQIGYRGYVTLAHRSPHIAYLQAECIHENDMFEHLVGSTSFLKFQKKLGNRGKPIGAFCFVKFANGSEAACVLDMDEIEKIRECSDTYTSLRDKLNDQGAKAWEKKKAQEKFDSTPWVLWFDDMAAKSAIKKMVKQLPMEQGSALAAASELEGGEGRIIDMGSLVDPDTAIKVTSGELPPQEADGVYTEADELEESPSAVAEAEPVAQTEKPLRKKPQAADAEIVSETLNETKPATAAAQATMNLE